MWTGLGVIFLIICLTIPIIRWIGIITISGAHVASGKDAARKEFEDAAEERRRSGSHYMERSMSASYRKEHLKEDPNTVIIGEKFETKCRWKNGSPAIYPYAEKEWVTEAIPQKLCWAYGLDYNNCVIEEYGCNTKDICEYLHNIQLMDGTDFDIWLNDKRKSRYYDEYDPDPEVVKRKRFQEVFQRYKQVRAKQYKNHCQIMSELAHRYIYFGECDKFKEGFIRLLMQDKQVTLNFIQDCHIANKWRQDNATPFDCTNYMKDFMSENHVHEKINKIMGEDVDIPDDLRHYRPETPSPDAEKHIKYECEKRNWRYDAAVNELESKKKAGIGTIIFVIVIICAVIFLMTGGLTTESAGIVVLGLFAAFLVALFVLINAGDKSVDAEHTRQKMNDDDKYINPFPQLATQRAKEYASVLTEKILSEPFEITEKTDNDQYAMYI